MTTKSRTVIATAAVVAGGFLAVGVTTSGIASSAEAPAAAAAAQQADGPLARALDSLVEDGTLTQEQADAVRQAFGAEVPPGARRWIERRQHRADIVQEAFDTAADVIGVSSDELHQGVAGGSSVGQVAEDHGVEPSAVVDALVDHGNERLDQAVADGMLTDAQADAIRERLPEGAQRLVDWTPPFAEGD